MNAAVLALFDVDDTITAPRKEVSPEMREFMKRLREVRPNSSFSFRGILRRANYQLGNKVWVKI